MTPQSQKTVALFAAAAAALLGGAGMVSAQSTPIRPLAVTGTGGEVFIEGTSGSHDETTGPGVETQEEDLFLEEGVEVRSEGYAYHPNLLDWTADLRLGFTQERITVDDTDRDSDGDLLGYNLTGLLLKEKPVSVRGFAARSEEIIHRDFARNFDLETEREGVEISTRGPAPMTLLLERHRLRELSDLRLDEEQVTHLRYAISHQPSPDTVLKLDYDHEETDQTITSFTTAGPPTVDDLPDEADEVIVNATHRFGEGPEQHRAAGHIRALDRRGFFPNRILAANSTLDLVHSDSLASFYRADYIQDDTETSRDRDLRGEVGATKEIYDSLDITGRGLWDRREFNEGEQTTVGGFLDFQYRKETPIGRYSSGLLLGHEETDLRSSTGTETVRGETVTLTGITFVPLDRLNVVGGSVQVMNLSRTITYVQGVDYLLQTIGARTEISRTAAGSILDGQVVLVDYTVQTAPRAEYDTEHLNWLHRLDLDAVPVAVYYEFRSLDDQLTSGEDPGNLDTEVSHLLGAELDHEGLRLVAEHEDRDQELFPPWTANRLRGSYTHPVSRQVDLSVGGYLERIEYEEAQAFGLEEDRDHLDTQRAYARVTAKLVRNLLVHGGVEHLETSGRENRRVLQVQCGLEWRYRDLEFSIDVRQAEYRQEQTDGTDRTLFFSLRRRF
ncbi:MAG: hypothetical protein R6X20_17350 [Phycisphaerae bacterium]